MTTLAFDFPRRSAYFTDELEAYLVMTRDEGMDPFGPVGSYAGAMGLGQFMPTSFQKYAVDFDGNGHRNLWDTEDAIGSVANYFAKKGNWQPGGPVTWPVTGVTAAHESLIAAGAKPSLDPETLTAAGIRMNSTPPAGSKVSLMDFETHDGMEYWLGMDNFYAIMRYNPRTKYAMAVYQLSEAIRENYSQLASAPDAG